MVTALGEVTRASEEQERLQGEVMRLAELVRALDVRNRQLQQALSSRIVIEQAKGVLAERLSILPDEAFELIRSAARRNRLTVRELAHEVVVTRKTPDLIAVPTRVSAS
jgi:AmiR/NasT family two-component response regulator